MRKTKQQKIVDWLIKYGWKVVKNPTTKSVKGRVILSLYDSGGVPYYFVGKSGAVRYGITYTTSHSQTHFLWVRHAIKEKCKSVKLRG